MKILVIGGTKFLGYHLVNSLLKRGVNLTLFNRGKTPSPWEDGIQYVRGDRKNYREFYDTFHQHRYDAVIDLIGYDPQDVEVAERTFRGHIGKYIFISTGQVYLVTENKKLPAGEDDFHQKLIPCPVGEEEAYYYGIRKREIEIFLEERYRLAKFPSVRLRCPVIHGERDYSLRLYSYLLRMADGHPVIIPLPGDSLIRHIYVGDVVRMILYLLENDGFSGNVFNLAQEEIIPLTEFLQVISHLMQSGSEIRPVPVEVLKKTGLPSAISPFSGRWVSYMDPARAIQELGFRPTPLRSWLPLVIDYFMNQYQGAKPDNYLHRPREIELLNSYKSE